MNPSERNKCRYSLVILVIESSSPKNPDELSQRAADSLLDAPVAVFQFGREPNMRETSAIEPEHSAEPHGTAHASSLVVNMPRRWSCKGVTFLKKIFFFFYFLAFCKDFTNHVVHVLKKYKDHQWTVYKMFKLWRFFISFKCMLVVNMTLPKRVGKEAAKDCKIGVLKFKW